MDARDRLAEIAKQSDAREKLNKIKNTNNKNSVKVVSIYFYAQYFSLLMLTENVFIQQSNVQSKPKVVLKKTILNNDTDNNRQPKALKKTIVQIGSGAYSKFYYYLIIYLYK